MGWKQQYVEKTIPVEAAAAAISSGENVYVGMLSNTPHQFARALVARAGELSGVKIYHYLSMFPWAELALASGPRQHVTIFATSFDRAAIADGRVDYMPLGSWCEEHLVRDHPPIDTVVVTLSPPDADGYMSFGSCLWLNGFFARQAKRVFAEIDETAIRTHGDNRIHVSQVERMWLRPAQAASGPSALEPQPDELSETICRYVARNLLSDGDCIQIGTGDVSARLAYHLGHLNDIGVQTELLPSGVVEMIDREMITGKFKELAPGKVVASAVLGSPDELRRVHLHPDIELWDFTRTDDVRLLSQISNFKTINNALQIDLGGQVTAETVGTRVYSGPGGQTAFAIAASYSNGGAAITVLPSSSMVKGVRRSRIVAHLNLGSSVTVPRTHVDWVVTEYGAAKISGRTLRERAEALIAIAHPECRDDLRADCGATLKLAST